MNLEIKRLRVFEHLCVNSNENYVKVISCASVFSYKVTTPFYVSLL